MKGILQTIVWVGLWCSVSGSLAAQALQEALVLPVKQVRYQRDDNQLSVSFCLELDTLLLEANRLVRLEPVLVHGDSLCRLTPIHVAGRKQAIMHRREKRGGILVERNQGKPQQYQYFAQVAYRDWMNGARLQLMQDVCGCGGHLLSQHQAGSYEVWLDIPVYELHPVFAFVTPKAEGIKYREESGRAFLDFPVNQVTIYPDYRNNPVELYRIRQTVEVVKNDSNTHITQIEIHGYASPEGKWTHNQRLAQGRAAALKQYVANLYHFDDEMFQVKSTPEDWEGLKQWIRESAWNDKEEILRVLAGISDEDERNAALQRWKGGKVYAYLLKEVYPALRHSDYTVHYTVRSFHVEESKRLLKTRPQLLSLQEMYDVAATYEAGSDEFHDVFAVAVRMFPEDEVANLNAALLCIHEKNYNRAALYLKKAGSSPEAIHARGVLALMEEDYEAAEALLKQAAEFGVTQATENLHQLDLKKENIHKRMLLNNK